MEPFSTLIDAHGAQVWRVCRALAGPDDADDAWQETFLAALRSFPGATLNNPQAWLTQIAHHKCAEIHRRRYRDPVPAEVADARINEESANTVERGDLQPLVAALQTELLERGEREGLIDAVHRVLDTPIGPVRVAASDRGIVQLGFSHETDFLRKVAQEVGPRILHAEASAGAYPPTTETARGLLELAEVELREYFTGSRREFTVPIDLHLSGFRGQVVRALSNLEYGRRASYKEIAAYVGNPGAVRAVGSACARNPIPIFLPCHRVVRSDGTWGNYRGGPEAKTFLLELERGG